MVGEFAATAMADLLGRRYGTDVRDPRPDVAPTLAQDRALPPKNKQKKSPLFRSSGATGCPRASEAATQHCASEFERERRGRATREAPCRLLPCAPAGASTAPLAFSSHPYLARQPSPTRLLQPGGLLQHGCAAPGPCPALLRALRRVPIHLVLSWPWCALQPAEDTAIGRRGLSLRLGVHWAALDVLLTRAYWLSQFSTR
jgi:hypothetical protein